jgi:hypothetical protein
MPSRNALGARFSRLLCGGGIAGALVASGCGTFGASTINHDRFDYVTTMSDSWKRQTLVNLVKLRYTDAPVFLEVDSLITAYTWEGTMNLGATGSGTRADSSVSVGATGRYADQPTITYRPLTGANFARSLMAPLPIATLFALLQNGYRADGVLRACVNNVNDINNSYGGIGSPRTGSLVFAQLMAYFREAQAGGRLDVRAGTSSEKASLYVSIKPSALPMLASNDAWFHNALGLDPSATEFAVVQGALPSNPHEIAFVTRSMLQVLVDLASYIDVPDSDVKDGSVYVPQRTAEELLLYPPLIRVHTSESDPPNAFTSVKYREHWFWVDDHDVMSKAAFEFLMLMFSLTDPGDSSAHPVLTIPAR